MDKSLSKKTKKVIEIYAKAYKEDIDRVEIKSILKKIGLYGKVTIPTIHKGM